MDGRKTKKFWMELLVVCLLLLVFAAPRAADLDRYITIDEGLWMYHSSQFYYALGQREFENTFQRFHPGVPMMWAGTFGFLVKFPEFRGLGQGYIDNGLTLGEFLEQNGKSPLDLVVAGRYFMVLQNVILLLLAYWAVRQFFSIGLAASIIGIVSLEPFFIGLTNILQMDGLMASYMFVSILALLVYLYAAGDSRLDWKKNFFFALSGVMAGVAVLAKAPAVFLLPYAGLMLGIRLIEQRDFSVAGIFKKLVLPILVWASIAMIVMVVTWPALWVQPIEMMRKIAFFSSRRTTQGLYFRIFFEGQTYIGKDLPWTFYPLSFIWRSSPVTLLGLVAAIIAWAKRWGIFHKKAIRRLVVGLVLAAVFFTLEMALGAMKRDRYIIPVHLVMASVGVIGWVALAQQFASFSSKMAWLKGIQKRAVLLVVLIVFGLQVVQVTSTYPYYFAYYNPLMGGTKGAEEMFSLGWGEGLEQVGAYLNGKPDAEQLSVLSLHAYGPLSYYFEGETRSKRWPEPLPFSALEDLDYLVIYVSERQTGYHPPVLAVFGEIKPEFVVNINGVEYAFLYDMDDISSTDWEYLREKLPE